MPSILAMPCFFSFFVLIKKLFKSRNTSNFTFERVEDLLAKGSTKEALLVLRIYFKMRDREYYNQIIVKLGQLADLTWEKKLSYMSYDDYAIWKNRINTSILFLITEYKQDHTYKMKNKV